MVLVSFCSAIYRADSRISTVGFMVIILQPFATVVYVAHVIGGKAVTPYSILPAEATRRPSGAGNPWRHQAIPAMGIS
jgi:hypothetical protein